MLMNAPTRCLQAETRRCLGALSRRAERRLLRTSLAVRDLDRVREALGYEQINLYGASYGTRVAQHLPPVFSQRTRSVILDGVVPPRPGPGTVLASMRKGTEAVLARCAGEEACRQTLRRPGLDLRAAASSHWRPHPLQLPLPTRRAVSRRALSSRPAPCDRIAAGDLQLRTGGAAAARARPRPRERGTTRPLRPIPDDEPRVTRTCWPSGSQARWSAAEDVPFLSARRAYRPRRQWSTPSPGAARLVACDLCRSGRVVRWIRTCQATCQRHSRVAALGGNDRHAARLRGARTARDAQQPAYGARGLGHGQIVAPCVDGLLADFLAAGSVTGLDVTLYPTARTRCRSSRR